MSAPDNPSNETGPARPARARPRTGEKLRGADKVARIPVKVVPSTRESMRGKPDWLRVRMPASPEVSRIKRQLRQHRLSSVCEEASCPNLGECFSKGTATFMILGAICTRRCPFCDVAHGRPLEPDAGEPEELAAVIADLGLKYVVITSVDRDDLRDGGAGHFARCVAAVRDACPDIEVEILVPDFRGRMDKALDALEAAPANVFNHNLESAPRLYPQVRPGSDYEWSLRLLAEHKKRHPEILTKSGLMVGLGETRDEIIQVMRDLRAHNVDMLTIGQYLQPSRDHLPVDRFVHPNEFAQYREVAEELGFRHAACGPLVRSSYHADRQAHGEQVG